MPASANDSSAAHPGACQQQFHQRWNHLSDPHVRALAWLLDAPDLLDPQAAQWQGKIASYADAGLAAWLSALEQAPEKLQALHRHIGSLPSTRLGLYAEKLMAFYFAQQQMLVAHSVQVRASKNDTIGEFDFLLRLNGDLVHWEFATKFYLLETGGGSLQPDDFLGPNLADSLGAKMQKILQRQLVLSQHPASQIHLSEPVASAQALVKGWLFYQDEDLPPPAALGVSAGACRGYWRKLSALRLDQSAFTRYCRASAGWRRQKPRLDTRSARQMRNRPCRSILPAMPRRCCWRPCAPRIGMGWKSTGVLWCRTTGRSGRRPSVMQGWATKADRCLDFSACVNAWFRQSRPANHARAGWPHACA